MNIEEAAREAVENYRQWQKAAGYPPSINIDLETGLNTDILEWFFEQGWRANEEKEPCTSGRTRALYS